MPRKAWAVEPLRLAALELFVEGGVHAAGVRDIARRAGCSEAALYRHWPSKEKLVAALFQEHLETVCRRLDEAVAGGKDLAGRVQAASQACYRLYDEEPLVFRFVLLVQHELARTLPKDLRMPQDVVAGLVAAGIREGSVRKDADPALLAAAVIGIFLETAVFVIYGRLPGPLARYADAVAENALRVLRR